MSKVSIITPKGFGNCGYCHQDAIAAIAAENVEYINYCAEHEWMAQRDIHMTHYTFIDSPYGLLCMGWMHGRNDLYVYDDVDEAKCVKLGLDPATLFYASSDDVAKRIDLQMAIQYQKTRHADLLKAAMQRMEAA